MTAVSRIAEVVSRVFNLGASSLDVSIQDQTTTPIDFYFVNIQGSPTTLLNAITTVTATTFVYTFDVVESGDMSVGDYVGIFRDSDIERFFFAEIQAISSGTGNATITVDTPIDFNFPAGSTVAAFVRSMNVDGSTTPVIYQVEIGPASDERIHLTRIMMQMKTDDPVSLAKFGDSAKLTNGLVFRKVTVEGVIQNIWTIKDNAQFALYSGPTDWVPYAALNPVQGQDGMSWRYTLNGPDKHGV
ncbi:hypothetical protein KAR91_48385, partial [Candidatus Pacearchaeota archaeon]|nr:hypothetical protein [Candidatus Pacearchaeota archaeon]